MIRNLDGLARGLMMFDESSIGVKHETQQINLAEDLCEILSEKGYTVKRVEENGMVHYHFSRERTPVRGSR